MYPYQDSKVRGANTGTIWVMSAPDGAIRVSKAEFLDAVIVWYFHVIVDMKWFDFRGHTHKCMHAKAQMHT